MKTKREERLNSFPKLKKMTGKSGGKVSEKDLAGALGRVAEHLEKSELNGIILFNIEDGRKKYKRALSFTQNVSNVSDKFGGRATLEVDTDIDTFMDIMAGKLAPFSAMCLNKFHIKGECKFARSVYSKLAGQKELKF